MAKPKTTYDERERVDAVTEAMRALSGGCQECAVVAYHCPAHRKAAGVVLDYTAVQARRLSAAVGLLLEMPVECSTLAPLSGRCGLCWTCRVDKFLRDAGARR